MRKNVLVIFILLHVLTAGVLWGVFCGWTVNCIGYMEMLLALVSQNIYTLCDIPWKRNENEIQNGIKRKTEWDRMKMIFNENLMKI